MKKSFFLLASGLFFLSSCSKSDKDLQQSDGGSASKRGITETLAVNGNRINFDQTSSGFFVTTDADLLQIGDRNTGKGVALYPLEGGTLSTGMTITNQQLSADGAWELGISLDKADDDYGTEAYHKNDQGSITITQYETGNNKQKISVTFNNVKCASSFEDKTVVLTGMISIDK